MTQQEILQKVSTGELSLDEAKKLLGSMDFSGIRGYSDMTKQSYKNPFTGDRTYVTDFYKKAGKKLNKGADKDIDYTNIGSLNDEQLGHLELEAGKLAKGANTLGIIGAGWDMIGSPALDLTTSLIGKPESSDTNANLAWGGAKALTNAASPILDTLVPGLGTGLKIGTEVLDSVNTWTGTTQKSLTSDMEPFLGYNKEEKSDYTIGGVDKFFGKMFGLKKYDNIQKQFEKTDRENLNKYAISYKGKQTQKLASQKLPDIYDQYRKQLNPSSNNLRISAKKGGVLSPSYFGNIVNKVLLNITHGVEEIESFKKGGQLTNVIPSGALHSRKNNYEGDLKEVVTDKGIPVISSEEGGKIEQHAEIEKEEIVFNSETTETITDLYNKWKDADEDDQWEIEVEAGKLLVYEILENTEDNTGLIDKVE